MAAPPLPDIIPDNFPDADTDGTSTIPPPFGPDIIFPNFRVLKAGSWLLTYDPVGSSNVVYDGTFRTESVTGGLRASGDLYQRPTLRVPIIGQFPRTREILLPPPNPADGIPVQAISKYAFFVRATKLLRSFTFVNSVDLSLELYRYSATAWSSNPNIISNWVEIIPVTATLTYARTPSPGPQNTILEGEVKDSNNNVLGSLKLTWLSSFLRKATVEIDTVPGSEQPLDSGAGHDWSTVGKDLGYDLTVVLSDRTIPEASGDSWSNTEMHNAMTAYRQTNNLDNEWRYHILAVKNIDETPRGIMYDWLATDTNDKPREGVCVSTHWTVPAGWGSSSGVRFGLAKAAHFRTAVHELGHALGLNRHNTIDLGFMNTSDAIARAGNVAGATPFPENIKWAFADDDLRRLRHRSDLYIRPGGVKYELISESNPPPSADSELTTTIELPELTLTLTPLLTEVPHGAPVRVEITLTNADGTLPLPAPLRIDLKSDVLRGTVTDPSGARRSFKSLIGCLDETEIIHLEPKQSITQSVTLLRGGEGALFPLSGVSKIDVQLRYSLPCPVDVNDENAGPVEIVINASTTVFVTAAVTEAHARAAHQVLTSPNLHLLLAFGAEREEWEKELEEVFKSEALLPHWGYVIAREKLKAGDHGIAKKFLSGETRLVCSKQEKGKLEKLLERASGSSCAEPLRVQQA